MNPAIHAKSMNEDLLSLYAYALPTFYEQIQYCIEQCLWENVSQPFFMHVDDEYVNASTKILFVGRETFGWGQYNNVSTAHELTGLYKNYSSGEKHFNSPFWWFREQFSQRLGIDQHFMKATLWTNLSKIDVNKTTPKGKLFGDLQQEFIQLLIAEIAIVKPDVVLIMTTNGHYNWHINNYNWLDNKPFSQSCAGGGLVRQPILAGKIDRLVATGRLPEHTYQMCHPNVFRRKVGRYQKHADEWIDTLASLINAKNDKGSSSSVL